jgi:hypothetical protein
MSRILPGLALCLGLVAAAPLRAQDPGAVSHATRWSASCALQGHAFDLHFESASGDVMNDDMQVQLRRPGQPAVRLPLAPAWYRSLAQLGGPPSFCGGLLALAAGGSRVVLVLPYDARPSAESFSVVLLDLDAGRVLDRVEDVGELRDGMLVTRRAGTSAFELRVVRGVLPEAQCDCREALIEDWRRIAWSTRRLRLDWAR